MAGAGLEWSDSVPVRSDGIAAHARVTSLSCQSWLVKQIKKQTSDE